MKLTRTNSTGGTSALGASPYYMGMVDVITLTISHELLEEDGGTYKVESYALTRQDALELYNELEQFINKAKDQEVA